MKRALYLLPLVVVIALVGYFAFGLTRDPRQLESVLIDEPLPQLDLPPLSGYPKGFATVDLGGKVSMVNLFASWCEPCKVEHPVLMRLKEEGEVPIYGVAVKDEPAATLALLRATGDPYESIGMDREGRAAIDLGYTGVPETFVVDRVGRIRYKQTGPITADVWEHEVKPVVDRLKAED